MSKVDKDLSWPIRQQRMTACVRATRAFVQQRPDEVDGTVATLMAQSVPGMPELSEEQAMNQFFSMSVLACYEAIDNETIAQVVQGQRPLTDATAESVFRNLMSPRRPSRSQVELYEQILQEERNAEMFFGEQARILEEMTLDDMPGALGNIGRKMSNSTKAAYVLLGSSSHGVEPNDVIRIEVMAEEELDVDSLHLEPFAPRTSLEGPPNEKGTESTPVPSKKSTSKPAATAGKAITVNGQLPYVRKKDGTSVKLDTNLRTGRRMSGSSGDPFDGDNLDEILKSLISTKKMDSAYQRIGKRLLALESYIDELRGGEGDEAFITRGEFIEFLQKSQDDVEAQIQAEHDARLAAEEARRLQEELEAQKDDPLIAEVRETLKAQEETNECNLKQAMNEARKADVQKWSRVNQLQEQIDDLKQGLGDESKKRQGSEALFEKTVKEIHKSIQDLEERMQSFAVNEAQKMIGALLFTNGATDATSSRSPSKSPSARVDTLQSARVDTLQSARVDTLQSVRVDTLQSQWSTLGSDSMAMVPVASMTADEARPSSRPEAQEFSELLMDRRQKAFARAREGVSGACGGPEEWRVAMLNLVDSGLIQPVRDQVERLHKDLLRQRDTFEKKNRAREKEIQETTKHGQKTSQVLREETEMRKQETIETSISFQKVYKVILESNEKIADDVQVAMDRIRTLQMMIDGHTKQIDGHTKGILDCATSEETAKLQESINKCVQKEPFSTQMSEVKTMVIKQSERIGSIDLQVSMMAKNVTTSPASSSRRGNLKKLGRVRSKTLNSLNRDASKGSMVASTAPGQDWIFAALLEDGDALAQPIDGNLPQRR
eukprot:s79_g18.t1